MLLVASCTVQKEEEFPSPSQHRYHAVAEDPVDAETRVFADSKLRVRWNEGDHISIFERNTYNQEFEFLGDTGDTAGDFDPVESGGYHTGGDIEDGHVYAIYPYDKKNKCDYEGKLTVTFPATQHYKKDSFGIGANVMVAKTNTMDLRFMHVGGYRTFKLYGEGVSVSSITIESNGDEYLSGRTDVTIGTDGKPAVSFIESTSNSKSVELVCDTPVALGGTAADAVEFWFVLPPGTLTQGFTVTITDIDGNEFTKSTSNSIEIKSGVKKSMPAFEVEIVNVPDIPVPEAVDLGLPSGLKWASFNLGASKPEEYGDYFAWGETEPYYSSQDPLIWNEGKEDGYDVPSYRWFMGAVNKVTKYCSNASYGYNGFTDTKTVLDPEDDAAFVKLGGNWRMPAEAEFNELQENCTWAWTSMNGINGRKATGPNGNSIFLPAAGYRSGVDLQLTSAGEYWSSSLNADAPAAARHVFFNSYNVFTSYFNRYNGMSVRPVYGTPFVSVESVVLDENELNLSVGATASLVATVLPVNATISSVSWSSSDETIATVSTSGVVTAIAVGSAIITVTTADGEKVATCAVTVTEEASDHAYVDMGNGLKWATMNVGASSETDYGDYFAWGETEPKSQYYWDNYKWCEGNETTLTKYNTNTSYGTVDNLITLEADDDAATVNWGSSWRTPTYDEWIWLIENCTWTWTSDYNGSGVAGRVVTSNIGGYTSNSIFLPAAGFIKEQYYLIDAGTCGYYWSSSLATGNPNYSRLVFFNSGGVQRNLMLRYQGRPIRPISD